MMEWNVYYYNCNANKMQSYNVLRGREDTIKKMKRKAKSFDEFKEELRREMMYYFWSKFEWEMTISSYGGLTDGSEAMRIDAWEQIKLNWNRFAEYCWCY